MLLLRIITCFLIAGFCFYRATRLAGDGVVVRRIIPWVVEGFAAITFSGLPVS